MSVVGLIAIRLKSGRLPQKALQSIAGKSVLQRIYERVSLSKSLDKIIVCTSDQPGDDRIAAECERLGYRCFRGDADDVMKRFLDAVASESCQQIVRITGDNPLTDPQVIDRLIACQFAAGSGYCRMDGLPAGVTAEVISRQALTKAYELANDSSHSEYMTWYFTKNDIFDLNIVSAPSEWNRPEYRLTIDYDADLQLIQRIYAEFDFDHRPPALDLIIEWLDSNTEVANMNKDVPVFHPVDADVSLKRENE